MTDRPAQTRPPAASRNSPFRLNLEQQRKRAKDLLNALRAGDADALSRFRKHHPGGLDLHSPAEAERFARLSEAQLVVARELRFPSWPKLKVHILAMEQAREHIAAGADSPDGDISTLHIRCGSDPVSHLKEAGFSGDFLEYSDALCQGPVLADDTWLTHRAAFLAHAYGAQTGQNAVQVAERLRQAEESLQSAAQHYERVVIWVEHDSYDQLVLARCLAQFAAAAPARLDLISVERFPGDARFIGLGQLPSEALRLLWDERAPVSAQQLEAGRAVWAKVRRDDPTPLALAARSGIPGLPQMAGAIQRHCQELPWLGVVHGSGGGAEALGDVGNRLLQPRMPILPFKLNQDRRHHIPRQQHKVTNWPAYDASLRQRGSLTVWFTDEAIAAWAAEPRTTRGGQPWYSPLAILTALTIRAVFRLAYRQAEGLIGSIIGLLDLGLRVPDHTTLSRRAATLDVPRPGNAGAGAGSEPMHLLVDSTGLKLCGKGEWLLEKHGTATRRSWRMLHLGVDACTGRIVASTLTPKDTDDASQAGPLLDQVAGPVASFTGDGAYDQDRVYAGVAGRHPEAAVVVPPRANAVPSDTAESAPTQRDGHLQRIAEHGRMTWQKRSGYNKRARVEATMRRWKQVIGDELRAHTDERRATEVAVAVHALNRMLEFGRPNYVRVA